MGKCELFYLELTQEVAPPYPLSFTFLSNQILMPLKWEIPMNHCLNSRLLEFISIIHGWLDMISIVHGEMEIICVVHGWSKVICTFFSPLSMGHWKRFTQWKWFVHLFVIFPGDQKHFHPPWVTRNDLWHPWAT